MIKSSSMEMVWVFFKLVEYWFEKDELQNHVTGYVSEQNDSFTLNLLNLGIN